MDWQNYDHTQNSRSYDDPNGNTYVYENGPRVAGHLPVVGYGGSQAAQTPRGSYGQTSSDMNIASDFSNLFLGDRNATIGSSTNNAQTYQTNVPHMRTNSVASYDRPSYGSTTTQGEGYPYTGYAQQPSYGNQFQPPIQHPRLYAPFTYPNPNAYMDQTSPQYTTQATIPRPSDEELLGQVGRVVDLEPAAESDLLRLGVQPHRRLRGTHGTQERLDPSFQVRYPGYNYYKRGVVFRVLWPELAGDVGQNITIATTAMGESIFHKIRWFVVVREGHNCCTCLPIQTYGGRGVPQNKPKSHHAIMYTGQNEPQPMPSEIVANEPPMGQAIRVVANKPYDKMDPMSRVNFMKVYTVEHNVKVEDFGRVHPDDEWKLISQFNSHWHIPGTEALPPATRPKYYDGHTYGPAPGTAAPTYAGSSTYSSSSAMPQINEHTTSGQYIAPYTHTTASHQYQEPRTRRYGTSNNSAYQDAAVTDNTYEENIRPAHHRRSSSHRSERSHGKRQQH